MKCCWLVLAGCLASVSTACSDSSDGDPDAGPVCDNPCLTYEACGERQDCIEGCCTATRKCSTHATCAPEGKCIDGRCVHICLNDTECPGLAACIYGFCEPYPEEVYQALVTSPAVDADWTDGHPLQVGIGDVPLSFPVGISMAGYGARAGASTPYNKTLGGSDSMWDRPRVKAFVFDDGLKRIALVRTATSWVTDQLVTRAAWLLHQETGENYLDRLVLSASHTHSFPGRYSWWMPGKGFLGHGEYSPQMVERHTRAIADAVLMAIADLRPARLGYTFIDSMDPAGRIHRDRRNEDADPMDDSLLVMRIDDDTGQPRAVLFDFALHGTHASGSTVTGDAPAAVEIIAQQNLQELTGLPVVCAFLSGTSGDVSPAGDETDLDDWRKIQQVGLNAWPVIESQFQALEGKTSSTVALDIANRRVPLNRAALGYEPGTFRDEEGNDYTYGAFPCVLNSDEDPETRFQDGALGCLMPAEDYANGVPIPAFSKARLSVLRFGDLGMVTIPGEPLGKYGRDFAQALLDEGFADAAVLGYSQDHHLYLMHADNWLQGGYEPSMGLWGWAEGDYYLAKAAEMIQAFASEGGTVDNAGLRPSFWTVADDPVVPTRTPPEQAGAFIQDAPSGVERLAQIILRWTGGHPEVDLPRMTLEVESDSTFATATNGAGQPISDDGFSTMLHYLGDYDADHTWQLSFESGIDFPVGRYRIRIDGHFHDGAGTQPYTTFSAPFELRVNSRLLITGVQLDKTHVQAHVLYPAGPNNDDGQSAFTSLHATGYLHHSGQVPAHLPWPPPVDGSLKAAISLSPVAGEEIYLDHVPIDTASEVDVAVITSRDDDGLETITTERLPTGSFSCAPSAAMGSGTWLVHIVVRDAFDNTGEISLQLPVE